ncbi:hypothetical protein D9611_000433 [Ephemerocybe angulata]|uniref:FZ domain-containing protein n=1 Tax=Ephemerocybe angulata TaxID=980116 RepID=A0A8H5BN54_9AGAR|nr:hypothetical protein D9611_000433 [Tulosesus angulatus]
MHLLPSTLICLLTNILSAAAQTRLKLPLDAVSQFNSGNGPFEIPSAPLVSVSVATCSQNSGLRFLVTTESGSATPTTDIILINGQGNFTSAFESGGAVAVEGTGSFEIALSTTGQPMHQALNASQIPLFGDSTSNQAIIFSPPFSRVETPQPTYPNYTMLPVDVPQAFQPDVTPNYTLALFPTTNDAHPQTSCFATRQSIIESQGNVNLNQSLWLRDEAGWRSQFLLGGLTPATNYTAYLILDSTKIAGPMYFATKSAAFPCPLVANLPYCPGVAYAMPLAAPPNGAEIYTGNTLPTTLSDPIRSYLTNFTVTLNSFACGRDMYSPLVTCADCQREYRKWLCTISLPRCSEPSLSNPNGFSSIPPLPTATGLSASKNDQQQVLSALMPQQTSTTPRNKFLPQFDSAYQMLLPCIETCNAMDRACPSFLGFKCPTSQFNGAASYGIGYIDGKDGDQGEGLTGVAQDRYGNVWCQLG